MFPNYWEAESVNSSFTHTYKTLLFNLLHIVLSKSCCFIYTNAMNVGMRMTKDDITTPSFMVLSPDPDTKLNIFQSSCSMFKLRHAQFCCGSTQRWCVKSKVGHFYIELAAFPVPVSEWLSLGMAASSPQQATPCYNNCSSLNLTTCSLLATQHPHVAAGNKETCLTLIHSVM